MRMLLLLISHATAADLAWHGWHERQPDFNTTRTHVFMWLRSKQLPSPAQLCATQAACGCCVPSG
jgi:hypothetical protein